MAYSDYQLKRGQDKQEPTAVAVGVVCAWCKRTLREGSEPVSHGICAACADELCAGRAA